MRVCACVCVCVCVAWVDLTSRIQTILTVCVCARLTPQVLAKWWADYVWSVQCTWIFGLCLSETKPRCTCSVRACSGWTFSKSRSTGHATCQRGDAEITFLLASLFAPNLQEKRNSVLYVTRVLIHMYQPGVIDIHLFSVQTLVLVVPAPTPCAPSVRVRDDHSWYLATLRRYGSQQPIVMTRHSLVILHGTVRRHGSGRHRALFYPLLATLRRYGSEQQERCNDVHSWFAVLECVTMAAMSNRLSPQHSSHHIW